MRRFIIQPAQQQPQRYQRQYVRVQEPREPAPVRTKIYLPNNEIRSFTVESFTTLIEGLRYIGMRGFGTTYRLEYRDLDGDWVLLGSESEFREARQHANPRLIIRAVQPEKRTQRHTAVDPLQAFAHQLQRLVAQEQHEEEQRAIEQKRAAAIQKRRAAIQAEKRRRALLAQRKRDSATAAKKASKIKEAEAIWESILGGNQHQLEDIVKQFLPAGYFKKSEKTSSQTVEEKETEEEPVKITIKLIDSSKVEETSPEETEKDADHEIVIEDEQEESVQTSVEELVQEALEELEEENKEVSETEDVESPAEKVEEAEEETEVEEEVEEAEEETEEEVEEEAEEEVEEAEEEAEEEAIIEEDDDDLEEILVSEDEEVPELPALIMPTTPEDPAQEADFSQEIEVIKSMGFSNEKLINHLIKHHKGNVNAVIESLLKIAAN